MAVCVQIRHLVEVYVYIYTLKATEIKYAWPLKKAGNPYIRAWLRGVSCRMRVRGVAVNALPRSFHNMYRHGYTQVHYTTYTQMHMCI